MTTQDLPPTATDAGTAGPRTSPALVAVAWLVVGVPLAWGVAQTVTKSLDLFRPAQAQAAANPTAPAQTATPAPGVQTSK